MGNKAYYLKHRERLLAMRKARYAANKAKWTAANLKWQKENEATYKIYKRFYSIKRNYGLTKEDFLEMLDKANNKCQICSTDIDQMSANVDHCHKTGRVRGLLCAKCNKGLGHFKDNLLSLLAAAEYLKQNGEA